jgi:Tol biopolymer transport system component
VISDAEGNVLATFPTGRGWQIAWSPDSTRIAVWDDFFGGTIGVYGLDGARQTQLTMPPGWSPTGDRDPVWMPDGTSLRVENVVVPLDGGSPGQLPRGQSGASRGALWSINTDGSDLRRLIKGTAWGDWLSLTQTA